MGQNESDTLTRCDTKYKNDWRKIIDYFYTGSIEPGHSPPDPVTWVTSASGNQVMVHFPSRVSAGGQTENVGWRYQVAEEVPLNANPAYGYTLEVVYDKGFNKDDRTIHTDASLPSGSCYHARASNPVGWSSWVKISASC